MRMNRRVPVGVSLFITEVVLVDQPDEVHLEVKKCENWKSPSMAPEVPHCLSAQGGNGADTLHSKLVAEN